MKCLCELQFKGLGNKSYIRVKPVRDCKRQPADGSECIKCCVRDPLNGWTGYLPYAVYLYLALLPLLCCAYRSTRGDYLQLWKNLPEGDDGKKDERRPPPVSMGKMPGEIASALYLNR